MNGLLPALLVAAAFGIASASARPAARWIGIVVFVVVATAVALTTVPDAWSERAHLACSIAIVACSASIHFPDERSVRVAIVLAVAAGASSGAVASLAHERAAIVWIALLATATCLVARVAARRVPLAPKIVSSWLIAVALLAATLQMLPVTPGYLPDHLE